MTTQFLMFMFLDPIHEAFQCKQWQCIFLHFGFHHDVAKRSYAITRINRAGNSVRKLAFHKDACIPLKPCGVVGSFIVGARGVLVMARAMRKECLYVKQRPVGISKQARK